MAQERLAAIAGIHEYPLRVAPRRLVHANQGRVDEASARRRWPRLGRRRRTLRRARRRRRRWSRSRGLSRDQAAPARHHPGRRFLLRVPRLPRPARHRRRTLQRRRHHLRLHRRVNARADRYRRHGPRRRLLAAKHGGPVRRHTDQQLRDWSPTATCTSTAPRPSSSPRSPSPRASTPCATQKPSRR